MLDILFSCTVKVSSWNYVKMYLWTARSGSAYQHRDIIFYPFSQQTLGDAWVKLAIFSRNVSKNFSANLTFLFLILCGHLVRTCTYTLLRPCLP